MAEAVREAAMNRFRLLQPHLKKCLPLRVVASEAGVAFRTAQRWAARYQAHGLAGLARVTREDRGRRRAISLQLRRTVEGLALERPVLPASSILRQAKQMAAALDEREPSCWTVCAILRELPQGLVTLAHEGGKAYSDAFDLVHRREASHSNAV